MKKRKCEKKRVNKRKIKIIMGGAIMRKLKNVLNTVAFKSLSMVAAAAFMVTATNVNTCCWYYFGQDELPEEARKLRRF